MKLIIDTETWLFRAAAASEYEAEFSTDKWTYLTDISNAKDVFHQEMDRLQAIAPDHTIMQVLGDSTNFRYGVYPQYKYNRRKLRKPAGYSVLRDWVAELWPTNQLVNVEADDACGIFYEQGDIIASRDKDLRTIPGVHLTSDGIIEISQWEADHRFYCQALTGDSTDGYPGLKGVGPVAAAKLLAGCRNEHQLWQAVWDAYAKAGQTLDYTLAMARCARILRAGEYDFDMQRPCLWQPPT
jgi:DNA polymerase-1